MNKLELLGIALINIFVIVAGFAALEHLPEHALIMKACLYMIMIGALWFVFRCFQEIAKD